MLAIFRRAVSGRSDIRSERALCNAACVSEHDITFGKPNRTVIGSAPQNKGVVMAKKSMRREWTKEDVRELKTLARQKTPVAKIAKSLKRTPGATQQKAFTLGLSLDSRG